MFKIFISITPIIYFILKHNKIIFIRKNKELHLEKFKNDPVYANKFKKEALIVVIACVIIIITIEITQRTLFDNIILLGPIFFIFVTIYLCNKLFPLRHFETYLHCWNCKKKQKFIVSKVSWNSLALLLTAGMIAIYWLYKIAFFEKTICSVCKSHYSEYKPIK
jgi:hypothetical protein